MGSDETTFRERVQDGLGRAVNAAREELERPSDEDRRDEREEEARRRELADRERSELEVRRAIAEEGVFWPGFGGGPGRLS